MRNGAALRIIRTIIEPRNPRMGDGAGAHCARLQRYPQLTPDKALIPYGRSGGANRDDFRMCCRVMMRTRRIGPLADNQPLPDDDSTNGHLAAICGALCKL